MESFREIISRNRKEHTDNTLILEKNISDCLEQLNKSNDHGSKCLKRTVELMEENRRLAGSIQGLREHYEAHLEAVLKKIKNRELEIQQLNTEVMQNVYSKELSNLKKNHHLT